MKAISACHRFVASVALLGALVTTNSAVAQVLLADYPLTNDLLDASGLNGPVTLSGTTPPAQPTPSNGVCHNGVYFFSGGQDIRTANIGALTDTDFQLEIEFRLTALGNGNRPILVGGNGWRWIGFYTDSAGTLGCLYNNSNYTWSTTTVVADQWYAAAIRFENGNLELYLDGALIHQAAIGTLSTNNDFDFTTNNFSNGAAFDGCIRKIVISNDATLGLGSIAAATNHGDGCDGLQLDATTLPTVGNLAFELQISNGSTLAPLAFVAFGSSLVLPGADLTPIGMGGCFSYTSFDLGLYGAVNLTGGIGAFQFPIPPVPVFAGYRVNAQAISFTPTTSLGLSSSNGVRFTVGL